MSPVPSGSRKLPAKRRIKESREYAHIKSKGRRYGFGCVLLNWLLAGQALAPRVGIIVNRKVGNAVVRNLARRRLREVFRKNQHLLPINLQLVFVARPSIAGKSFAAIEHDFMQASRHVKLVTSSPES